MHVTGLFGQLLYGFGYDLFAYHILMANFSFSTKQGQAQAVRRALRVNGCLTFMYGVI